MDHFQLKTITSVGQVGDQVMQEGDEKANRFLQTIPEESVESITGIIGENIAEGVALTRYTVLIVLRGDMTQLKGAEEAPEQREIGAGELTPHELTRYLEKGGVVRLGGYELKREVHDKGNYALRLRFGKAIVRYSELVQALCGLLAQTAEMPPLEETK